MFSEVPYWNIEEYRILYRIDFISRNSVKFFYCTISRNSVEFCGIPYRFVHTEFRKPSNENSTRLKETVPRNFSSLVFFIIKQLLLVPIGMPRNNFKFFRIFVGNYSYSYMTLGNECSGELIRIFGKYCTVYFYNDSPFKDCCVLIKNR